MEPQPGTHVKLLSDNAKGGVLSTVGTRQVTAYFILKF